jgi:predicted nucleic acid-binding protein
MATYLLDTRLALRHIRGQRHTVQLLRRLGKESRLAIASVTRLEVHADMQAEKSYATRKLLARLATLDLDWEIADQAGDLIAANKRAGRALNVPDASIAATTKGYHLTLVTLDQRDFRPIAGLRLYALNDLSGD